jgi:CheY-like chemotaxis protein
MTRILVIDDDVEMRLMLKEMLSRAGYEVLEAADGNAGMEMFRSAPTDIIITDIIMPEKDGWETIVELRKDFPEVKIIAISGGDRIGPFSYLMVGKKFGANQVLPKPIKRDTLLRTITQLLEG